MDAGIDKLLILEKQARNVRAGPLLSCALLNARVQAADLSSTSRVLLAITSILWESSNQQKLSETILALSKKHGQLKQAVVRMVEQAMSYLDQIKGQEDKIKLIECLREVTEGKVRLVLFVSIQE